jgi:hypothetical protein
MDAKENNGLNNYIKARERCLRVVKVFNKVWYSVMSGSVKIRKMIFLRE